jgi:hypothetical protein
MKPRWAKGRRKRADRLPEAVLWWLEHGRNCAGSDHDAWQVSALHFDRRRRRLDLLDSGRPARAGLRAADRRAHRGRAVPPYEWRGRAVRSRASSKLS